MHRPFNSQAIEQLVAKGVRNDPERAFQVFIRARNMLLHGDDLPDIEQALSMPMSKAVNMIGKVAWISIMNTFKFEKPTQLCLLEVNMYTHQMAVATGVMQLGGTGDPSNPRIEDFPLVQLTMERIPEEMATIKGNQESKA